MVTPFPHENAASVLTIGPRIPPGRTERDLPERLWKQPYRLIDTMVELANMLGTDFEVPESYFYSK